MPRAFARATAGALSTLFAMLVLAGPAQAQEADPTHIIFTSNACVFDPTCVGFGGYQLYRVRPAGMSARVTSFDCGIGRGTWTPDASSLVVAAHLRTPRPDGGLGNCSTTNLFRMAPDGSGAAPLTSGTGIVDEDPDVSPDGRLIAFDSSRGDGASAGRRDIHVMQADGTGLRRLTNFHGHDGGARFTADGETLVFTRSPGTADARFSGDPIDLWAVDVRTGSERQLTTGGGFIGGAPAPSPDGRSIAYSDGGRIYRLDLETGAFRQIVDRPSGYFDGDPAWSPDGKQLTFARVTMTADGGDEVGTDIMRAPADGRGRALIVADLASHRVSTRNPRWGGRRTVVAAGRDVTPPVTLLGSAGSGSSGVVVLGDGARAGAARAARAAAARRRIVSARARDLTFLTADRSGVRKVQVAFRRRGANAPLRWRTVRRRADLRRLASGLPRGTYEVRFRATDVRGNRTRRPVAALVRLRG